MYFYGMEMKYFRLIKTIAEKGSIANATATLFVTQSALSHQLRELENQLGYKVFHRSRNQWQLTEEGKELYALSCRILDNLEEGMQAIARLREGAAGTIKLSTECYSFYQGLPHFIEKMQLLYPQIQLDLVLEATHQPIDKLVTNEIDIAIVSSKATEPSLTSIETFNDEVFALMHKEHPYASSAYIDATDFQKLHLLIHSYPLNTVAVYQHFLHPHQVTPAKITAIPLTEVALAMVQANQGIMCVPKWTLNAFQLTDQLVYKQIGKKGLKRSHYLVTRTADLQKKCIRDFVTNFSEEFTMR